MPLNDLITADAILPALRVNSKKAALHEMSERAAAVSGLGAREIYDAGRRPPEGAGPQRAGAA